MLVPVISILLTALVVFMFAPNNRVNQIAVCMVFVLLTAVVFLLAHHLLK